MKSIIGLVVGSAGAYMGYKALNNSQNPTTGTNSTTKIERIISKVKNPTSAIMPSLVSSQVRRFTPNFSNLGLNGVSNNSRQTASAGWNSINDKLNNITDKLNNNVNNTKQKISDGINATKQKISSSSSGGGSSSVSSGGLLGWARGGLLGSVSSGGLLGLASDTIGFGTFFSGAKNIKNLVTAGVTGQQVKTFNTKYGTQTYLTSPKKSSATASQVASNSSNMNFTPRSNIRVYGPVRPKKTIVKSSNPYKNLTSGFKFTKFPGGF